MSVIPTLTLDFVGSQTFQTCSGFWALQ